MVVVVVLVSLAAPARVVWRAVGRHIFFSDIFHGGGGGGGSGGGGGGGRGDIFSLLT